MASQGPLSPDSYGIYAFFDFSWSGMSELLLDDGFIALTSMAGLGQADTLQVEGFGFAIPAGATIDGVEIGINDPSIDPSATMIVQLRVGGYAPGTGDYSAVSTTGWRVLGSPTSLWGSGGVLDPDSVNAADFGVHISATNDGGGTVEVSADAIRMTVYYTGGGPPPQTSFPASTVAADSWVAVGAATLHETMQESVPGGAGDSDYALSPVATTVGNEVKLRVSVLNDPGVGTDHLVRYRYGKSNLGGEQVNLTVNLYRADGTTLVATTTITNIGAITTGSFTLTGTEADSIPSADYTTGLVLGFKEVKV